MRMNIKSVARDEVLAGAVNGAAVLSELIAKSANGQPGVVFLDFSEIRAATGSFLREAVLGFRDHCRRSDNGRVPVLANANDCIVEELHDLLARKADAIVVCELDAAGNVLRPRILGVLEEKQQLALSLVMRRGETDASSLAADDQVGVTAWNNRLATLASKGILVESRLGRTKRYRPVLEELSYGT